MRKNMNSKLLEKHEQQVDEYFDWKEEKQAE